MSMSTILKDKGKFHPRTSHEGLEREYRCNFTVSLTLALYVGGWFHPHCALGALDFKWQDKGKIVVWALNAARYVNGNYTQAILTYI